MSKEVIARASEIINAKAGYIGGGMRGYAAVSLIDENGYPSTATVTIATADGINQLTFCTSKDRNFITRVTRLYCIFWDKPCTAQTNHTEYFSF